MKPFARVRTALDHEGANLHTLQISLTPLEGVSNAKVPVIVEQVLDAFIVEMNPRALFA